MSATVLVTGCSSGIGRATARLFADRGWNVVATMRRPNGEGDERTLVTHLDVTEPASIAAAVEAGIARFGGIDLLVNNAGRGHFGLFEATSEAGVKALFDVDLFGVMAVTRALLPHFRARRAGMVVNVSSGAGLFTLPMSSLYCAAKFALEGFSEALSYELAAVGVGVKLVIPHGGVTGTDFGRNQALAVEGAPPDYADFVGATAAAFGRMVAARSLAAEEVAEAIFGAATDGTARLRYLVGDDARGFVKARQTLADQDYVDYMRAKFRP